MLSVSLSGNGQQGPSIISLLTAESCLNPALRCGGHSCLKSNNTILKIKADRGMAAFGLSMGTDICLPTVQRTCQ